MTDMKTRLSLTLISAACISLSAYAQNLTDYANPFLGTATLWETEDLGYERHKEARTWGAEVFPGTEATAEPAEPELRADAAEEARAAEEDTGQPVKKFRWWIPLLVLFALAAIFLAVFLILAHVAPDFIDSILYTPEELRIINY